MKDLFLGASYVLLGLRYLFHKKIRKFVFIPLLINMAVFALCFYWGYDILSAKLQSYQASDLPAWLSWMSGIFDWLIAAIKWLVTLLWFILFLFLFSFGGSIAANFFASPFTGLLCESMDEQINHFTAEPRPIFKLITLALSREISKWIYYLPRLIGVGIVCLVLYFIPVVNILATIFLYLFGAWMLAFQYLDYPADNRHHDINVLKKILKQKKMMTYGFGLAIFTLTLVPMLNFIILPLATLSATKLWADHYESLNIASNKEANK
ncbi:sulfate transporter CysZ [Candidatus Berkiella cookevillensis]|uniref:Putative sulfate transport protein CysZ n=1 Tax=Candidatus Berkiella cookevillensis TaxID=437022 RepID=A0A0Q9YN11_9GAMM|nr:sulfate transporter CysZ [Candidatus Berkiella cookevillensis]MCS5709036.1 sulfate transporter CysZ [Candidatus Berkiella cookevillensis]